MKIKFKEERDTILLGRVEPGKIYDSKKLKLPVKEFEAFVKNGVAVEVGVSVEIQVKGNILDPEQFAKELKQEDT